MFKCFIYKNTHHYTAGLLEIRKDIFQKNHMGYSCCLISEEIKVYKDVFNFCSMTEVRNLVKSLATQ